MALCLQSVEGGAWILMIFLGVCKAAWRGTHTHTHQGMTESGQTQVWSNVHPGSSPSSGSIFPSLELLFALERPGSGREQPLLS